jgi:hypothetical protein
MISIVGPAIERSSEGKGKINLIGGGNIDIWSLENPLAGRGRKYKLVVIDEAAFGKSVMFDQWERNIRPTLVDYRGIVVAMSNTNGINNEQFFWRICNEPQHEFKEFHAPCTANPYLPAEELEDLRNKVPPLVWQQEYLAEFVDWSGHAFFSLDKMLVDGLPVESPRLCDTVFAVIDTASKAEKQHDGTAVVYFSYTRAPAYNQFPLVILDWDYQQIEGAMLESWLPSVFENCESLARQCRARSGSVGALIEDKDAGVVLLQKARNNKWPARPIDSKITSIGKRARAINASGPYFQGKVKITADAFDKVVIFKEKSANHLRNQVVGCRIDTIEDPKNQDDLLDCFCSGVAMALGDRSGFAT